MLCHLANVLDKGAHFCFTTRNAAWIQEKNLKSDANPKGCYIHTKQEMLEMIAEWHYTDSKRCFNFDAVTEI